MIYLKKNYLIGLSGVVATWVLMSFVPPFDLKASMARGKKLYTVNCVNCHMVAGEGLEKVFPPLSGSANMADEKYVVNAIAKGMSGPVKVKGVQYNGSMSPYPFNDQEMADLLNYIRNSWGNQYGAIRADQVQPILKGD